MKVVLNNVTLLEGQSDGPSSVKLNDQELLQKEPLLRAAEQALFARGNTLTTIDIVFDKEWPDTAEAQKQLLIYRASIPKQGVLSIVCEDVASSKTIALTSAHCFYESGQHDQLGARTFHQLKLVCTALT